MHWILVVLGLGLGQTLWAAPPRRTSAVPTLNTEPVVDGRPSEAKGLSLPGIPKSALWFARVAMHSKGLWLAVSTREPELSAVTVTLHFPKAALGAEARTFVFDSASADAGLTSSQVGRAPGALEVFIPLVSFPPFPARGPLELDLCIAVGDPKGPASSNCEGGAMKAAGLTLPLSLHRTHPTPPSFIQSMEPRPGGWRGLDSRGDRIWMQQPTGTWNAEALGALAGVQPVAPEPLGIFIPQRLAVPKGSPLMPLIEGKDPYRSARCDPDQELRMTLWAVEGTTALRVLEWPVASCRFGRASSVVLDDDGGLTIGYSSGATVSFIWTGTHFERTELGALLKAR